MNSNKTTKPHPCGCGFVSFCACLQLLAEASTGERIEQTFPDLTPSERNIAQLILMGCKLGSICMILNKTESNVNTQRANIRRKLGLQPTDSLYEALKARMDGKI